MGTFTKHRSRHGMTIPLQSLALKFHWGVTKGRSRFEIWSVGIFSRDASLLALNYYHKLFHATFCSREGQHRDDHTTLKQRKAVKQF